MFELLKRLSEAPGLSSSEDNVRNIIYEELKGHADKVEKDRLGNLIFTKEGKPPKVMLAAHMDEIGLMVKFIDEKGFVRFIKVGGFYDPSLLNQRVVIHGEKDVYGVIGSKPPHLLKEEEKKKEIKSEDMFIDVGALSREDCKKLGIKHGDPITLEREMIRLANNLVTGKAFDDRVGCAILIETFKGLKTDNSVYAVFTVQEEVGLKGATVSSFKINPDVGIAIDVTTAGDYPGMKEHESPIYVGKGPAIKIADGRRESLGGGLISHPLVRQLLIETAKAENIPHQVEILEGGTTDATAIHLSREGVPSGVLSIPTRYIHSAVEVLSLDDVENSVKLLRASLKRVNEYFK